MQRSNLTSIECSFSRTPRKKQSKLSCFEIFGEANDFGETGVNQKMTKSGFNRGIAKTKNPANQ
jgi:hypothetical protein